MKKRECIVPGCIKKHKSKGFCRTHYTQYQRGILDSLGRKLRPLQYEVEQKRCSIPGCNKKYGAKGFCTHHYVQYKRGILDKSGKKLRPLKGEVKLECSIPGCVRKYYAKGFCRHHYDIDRFNKFNKLSLKERHKIEIKCRIKGCQKTNFTDKYFLKKQKICDQHYRHIRKGIIDKSGKVLRQIKKCNPQRGCIVLGCTEKHSAKGFCKHHYRQYTNGILDKSGKKLRPLLGEIKLECSISGCTNISKSRGICDTHYTQWRRKIIDLNGKRLRKRLRFTKEEKHDQHITCKLCDEITFANGFCKYHYGHYRLGVIDLSGKKLRPLKSETRFQNCKFCGEPILGRGGRGFCEKHYRQYHVNGLIDFDGNLIPDKFQNILESEYLWNKIKDGCKGVLQDKFI